MIPWLKLTDDQKKTTLTTTAGQLGIPEQAVEKDVWVTLVLQALFSLEGIKDHLVFKGGTSLSKGYKLIERFSEDIDFAIDRSYFGMGEIENPSQLKKLRITSAAFAKGELTEQLGRRLLEMGVPEKLFSVIPEQTQSKDREPVPVFVQYHSVLDKSAYLNDRVVLEISGRSLTEPCEKRTIRSMLSEAYPDQPFSGEPFDIPCVLPSRTFLEKAFLLHEQFSKKEIITPRNRMSRHLYDLERLMDTDYAKAALQDQKLYNTIVAQRKNLTPERGITYDQHGKATINFIPPNQVLAAWQDDYQQLVTNMISGEHLPFKKLVERLKELQERFRETGKDK